MRNDVVQRPLQQISPGTEIAALGPTHRLVANAIQVASQRRVVAIISEKTWHDDHTVPVSPGHAIEKSAGIEQARQFGQGAVGFGKCESETWRWN